MKPIPKTENPLVIRTDFSNQSAWEAICATIQKPVGIFRFRANMEFLDDEEYVDIATNQLMELLLNNYNQEKFAEAVDEDGIFRDFPKN